MSALAVGLALVLDAAVGEPPERFHPVAWFGRLVAPLDREWPRPRATGLLAGLALPLGAAVVVAGAVRAAGLVSPLAATAAAGVVLFVATSLRRLLSRVREVCEATGTDLGLARKRVRSLAGRPTAALTGGQVRSAAVESAAENLADGLVAPLAAFVLGAAVSLPVAAGAATWVKAVNTMDSMLGYRSKPVGWASARLDDAVMWLPARISALLIAVAAGVPTAVAGARRWRSAVPSPNSGWPMGALAAALDVRLEKQDVYTLNAEAAFPSEADAARGVRVIAVAGLLAHLLAAWLASLGAGVVAWS